MSAPPRASLLGQLLALVSGLLFAGSLMYFVYAYGQFGRFAGRWTLAAAWLPVAVNVLVFTAFAMHHSLFARSGLKAAIAAMVPAVLERAVYVAVASSLFIAVLWLWQPVPGVLWHIKGHWISLVEGLAFLGLMITATSAMMLDPLELAGIRQAMGQVSTRTSELTIAGFYGIVRHPIYLGWLLLVWPQAVMTGTRFTFAVISTVYLLVAIPWEEREMRRARGKGYEEYTQKVPWRIIPGVY